jgi:large subunit ribosomal protein L3
MSLGLVGRKCGMTRIFRENGDSVPVTVIEALPNRVTTVKTAERDGYRAVQVTVGTAPKAGRTTKAEAGHFAQTKIDPGRGLYEFRLGEGEGAELAAGAELKVDQFKEGQFVDVSGTTKGKGYAGVIKRHNFSHQYMSHGNSLSHRAPGAIGQRQTPGRVFPGKRMAGRLGADKVTKINLEVVKVDADRNLILVKGAVPGSENGQVVLRPAVKAARAPQAAKAAPATQAAKAAPAAKAAKAAK